MFGQDDLVSTQADTGGSNHLEGPAIAQDEAMKQKQIRYSCFHLSVTTNTSDCVYLLIGN
jgi:hypothetical protein